MVEQSQRDPARGSGGLGAAPPQGSVSAAIRRATLADTRALAAIEASAFVSDRLTVRAFKHLIMRANAATLVHLAGDGTISGYAVVLFHRRRQSARLYSIAVASGYRRSGHGATLLAAAESAAAAHNAATMTLEVRADSAAAQNFYAAHGYSVFGELRRYYADGTDARKMRKALPPRHGMSDGVSSPSSAAVIKA